jgi:hypothetical protein
VLLLLLSCRPPCSGDALKKETAQRLLKLRAEAEELEGVTFAPVINERSKQAEGRLRILVEPDNYVQRLQVRLLLCVALVGWRAELCSRSSAVM